MDRQTVLILGKIPPPYYGPAVATEILLNSSLNRYFNLCHFDTRLNKSVNTIGRFAISKLYRSIIKYWHFVKSLKRNKPSAVLVPVSQSVGGLLKDSVFIVLAYCWKSKAIIHLRGSNLKKIIDGTSFIFKAYIRIVFGLSRGAIVLGANLTPIFADYFPAERIFVVPNGADYDFPVPDNRGSGIEIVYLSNLQASKGIMDFIAALAYLRSNEFNISIKVYGEWRDNETKEKCLNAVKENRLAVYFSSLKNQNNKLAALADADIFVFPPREPEGHPWVIVEALAAGLPIISTDQGAIKESVCDGWNGFIVEPENPPQIAEKMQYLIENEKERKTMGRRSRQHYEANFTEEKMVDNLKKCLDSVFEQ